MPRRGYLLVADTVATDIPKQQAVIERPPSTHARRWLVLGSAVILVLVAVAFWQRRVSTAASSAVDDPGGPPSVAVLAFKGPSDDADGSVLARNVAADLVSELARSANLRVVLSQSGFPQLAEGKTPLAEVGRRLRSRHIVDGSVRREGEHLRVGVLADRQPRRLRRLVVRRSRRSSRAGCRAAGPGGTHSQNAAGQEVAGTEAKRRTAGAAAEVSGRLCACGARKGDDGAVQRAWHPRVAALLHRSHCHRGHFSASPTRSTSV